MSSAMAFQPALARDVACQVHFGTKRDVKPQVSTAYVTNIILGWNLVCPLLAAIHGGYLPAKEYGIGGDGETMASLLASKAWVVHGSHWKDGLDGFDYDGIPLDHNHHHHGSISYHDPLFFTFPSPLTNLHGI
jgi:hypothetical protein